MPPPIALRLAAPLVAVSLLLLAVGVAAAWHVHRSDLEMASLLTHDISSASAAEELVIATSQVEIKLDQYLLTGDPVHLDAAAALRGAIQNALAEAGKFAEPPPERAMLRGIESEDERFWAELAALSRRARGGDVRREIRGLSSLVLTRGVRIPAQAYLDEQKAQVASAVNENQRMPGRIAAALLALGICGAAAGLLSGFGIARGISRTFAQLSVSVSDAAGKLSEVVGPITLAPARDVAGIEDALRRLAEKVGTVVERLEQSRRETLRSEQLAALGQWAAGLAHELRNPLTSMNILVQSAAERGGADGPGLRGRPLAVLEEEIGRLDRLLRSFLDFARPAEVERRAVELAPILEQKLNLVGPRAASRGITIEREQPAQPVVLRADAGHLRQLLLNLLLNALDAAPPGGHVWVRVSREEPAGPRAGPGVAIEIADNGPGLPADLGERIFEPFVTTKETGPGLGLSICRRIAEAHGGSLAAADRPGGGASFVVRLPLDEADSRPAARLGGPAGASRL
ncbi:MAG: ATP-binding protein [Isosphaeraceae bacterium]